MIDLKYDPGQKIIELGGGACPRVHPNVDVRMTDDEGNLLRDANGNQAVDFTADFNKPLPIQSDEWDGVFSHFALEHVGYPYVRQFIAEIFRILKPGGKAVIITANTEAQLKWIQDNPAGWDNEDPFTSCSKILFGGQDYGENAHRSYFSPSILNELFAAAGFQNIIIQPYGARGTDICVQAVKTKAATETVVAQPAEGALPPAEVQPAPVVLSKPLVPMDTTEERAALYDYHYFNTGQKVGGYAGEGYRDFPVHEITAKYVLARRPESVLELGCARGYIVKRLLDAGVRAVGLEISKHCHLTEVCNELYVTDLCVTPWNYTKGMGNYNFDLCLSIGVLEHIPEQFIPAIAEEMARTCKRGLHGITLSPPHPPEAGPGDRTICTLRSKEWWQSKLPPGHEVVNKDELEQGPFPPEVLKGDGKIKLNVGCGMSMFHHGWQNLDIEDMSQFAAANGYQFHKCDVRQGLPFNTGQVDLIYAGQFLDYLTRQEALGFLRECRRVLNPHTGAMRVSVPDAWMLMNLYRELQANLSRFDELNADCASSPNEIGKLEALMYRGRRSVWDLIELECVFESAGFVRGIVELHESHLSTFDDRNPRERLLQIVRETVDTLPCVSMYMEAIPDIGK